MSESEAHSDDAAVTEGVGEIISDVTADSLVRPSVSTLESLADVSETTTQTQFAGLTIIGEHDTLKAVRNQSVLAARLQQVISSADITLLSADTISAFPPNTVISDGRVFSVTEAGGELFTLQAADAATIEGARTAANAITDATAFDLRMPPIDQIRNTAADGVNQGFATDLNAYIDYVTQEGEQQDFIEVCLLLAARNEGLLYDIGRWGEDTGIASKATFSRSKTELEEAGLIDTEKVPIDVGRPRLRLGLAGPAADITDPISLVSDFP